MYTGTMASTPADAGDAGFSATVYGELRAIAGACLRDQPAGHTLQPTALVNEAWLRLADRPFSDRRHFVAVAARAMRQILVDHARRRGAMKRRGDRERLTVCDPAAPDGPAPLDVVALDAALHALAAIDDRQARVVELRFFGGLNVEETADAIGVSPRTVEMDWRLARAWLSRELS